MLEVNNNDVPRPFEQAVLPHLDASPTILMRAEQMQAIPAGRPGRWPRKPTYALSDSSLASAVAVRVPGS